MEWQKVDYWNHRLVASDGRIVDEISCSRYDGTWTLAYNHARYVSEETAKAAAERIHQAESPKGMRE